jgi:nicotinate-nucleotide adenylyltransferase
MGGTFDPVHVGHLIIAQEVGWRLELDRVLFMPAANPPHKQHQQVTSERCRLEMVRLATQDNPLFEVETLEIDRGGLSYTAATLEALSERLGKPPETALYFIIGSDAAADLLSWHNPVRVLELTQLAVVERPGYHLPLDRLQAGLPQVDLNERIVHVEAPLIEIAANEIRMRVQQGAPIKYLVSPVVEDYIRREKLYLDVTGNFAVQ